MSHGEFLSLVRASCSDDVYQQAQELVDNNYQLTEDLFEQDNYVADLLRQIDELILYGELED